MSYCGVACGQFRSLPHPQDVDGVFPLQGPVTGAARQHNPQHFPIRAQAQGRFAQVIHMVVHNRESEREAPVPSTTGSAADQPTSNGPSQGGDPKGSRPLAAAVCSPLAQGDRAEGIRWMISPLMPEDED